MPTDPKKVVLITGASRGIGRGIALAMAEEGWAIGVNFVSNAEAARETVHRIRTLGGEGMAIQGDVGKAGDRERILDETMEAFGRLDALVNNAGVAPKQRLDLLESTEEGYDQVMAINLKGPFFLAQAASRLMIRLRREGLLDQGYLVNISSISAYTASVNRAEYCLAKAGLSMVTALFAARLAEEGVGVYEVRPGIVATDMTEKVKEKYNALIADGLTPIRRWGHPEDVGRCVRAILRGDFSFSPGQVFNVDGGFHLRTL